MKVNGDNIRQHITNYKLSSGSGVEELPIGEIPLDILGWPARGNKHFK
jgi:hypothetical protein